MNGDIMKYIIAYDLGTGGMKASLWTEEGISLESSFVECETFYPLPEHRNQRPQDWWDMLVNSTKSLLSKVDVDKNDILGIGISGHSLGVVPIGNDGALLKEYVPVWSDARAQAQQDEVFEKINEDEWYLKTGNGFPAKLYGAFKILWYKQNEPEMYDKAKVFIGTKDYLNYMLTGELATDHSYASGSGVYDLEKFEYDKEYIAKMGLRESDFPVIRESSDIIGKLKPEIAELLGLSESTIVSHGGVDNACMSAGAGCVEDGMAYTSLGTSSWIAITSSKPVVSTASHPYVFAHVIKGKFASATSIFSAGNTFRWVRDVICTDLVEAEKNGGLDSYIAMDKLAEASPIGANGVFMVPHLAGGSGLDKSVNVRGSFTGLDLKHTKGDLVRASLEGICHALKVALDELAKEVELKDGLLIVGGGSKSKLWMKLFADIYALDVITSSAGENAGSLGAMATAAIACGLWNDYSKLKEINKATKEYVKVPENVAKYAKLHEVYKKVSDFQSEIAEIK